MLSALSLVLCLGCELPQTQLAQIEGVAVDVELVLAVDVSRSMDYSEFVLQRAGYVAALRDPDFIKAVQAGFHGRIALTYYEWSSSVREESIVPWQIIDGPESAEAFAAKLEARPFGGFRGTSISSAIKFGMTMFDMGGFDGIRRVIDVSGDGPNNIGTPVTDARDKAVDAGIVVNGLPILVRPSPTFRDLDRYYAECVIGGPGSFVLPIKAPDEFATAIRRKLILEVSGAQPDARIVPVQAEEPVDCLKGERDRRFFSDPYYPELDR